MYKAHILLSGIHFGGMNMLVFADRYPSEVAGWCWWTAFIPINASNCRRCCQLRLRMNLTISANSANFLVLVRLQIIQSQWIWRHPGASARREITGQHSTCGVSSNRSYEDGWGNIPDDLIARLDKIWLDLHKEYLNLSTDSSLILAEHSGHFIQQDEPQVVIDAILKLVDKARQK